MIDFTKREEVCPSCKSPVTYSCHMTYGTWHCWGCGIVIDSRVAMPEYREKESP